MGTEWIQDLKRSDAESQDGARVNAELRMRDDQVLLAKLPDVWSALTEQLTSDIAELEGRCVITSQTDTRFEFRNSKLPYHCVRVSLRADARTIRLSYTCTDGIVEHPAKLETVSLALQPGDYVMIGPYSSVADLSRRVITEVLKDCPGWRPSP
jgi:hypothetical protein